MRDVYLALWVKVYEIFQYEYFLKLTALILLFTGMWLMFRRRLFFIGLIMLLFSLFLALFKVLALLFSNNFPSSS